MRRIVAFVRCLFDLSAREDPPHDGDAARRRCSPAAWVARLHRRALGMSTVVALTLVVLGAAALIVSGETRRLIESALTPQGEVGSLGAVEGLAAFGERDVWTVWQNAYERVDIARWIVVDTGADFVFYLAYVAVLLRLLRDLVVARRLVLALAAAEVAETLLVVTAAANLAEGVVPGVLRIEVALAATTKWLLVALLVLALLRNGDWRARAWQRSRLIFTAVKYQRLGAVPVVVLGLLSTVPGPDIQDQFPDVERAWVDSGAGVAHAVAAALCTLLVAFLLFVLGRYRTRRAQRTRGDNRPPDKNAPLWVWLVAPAAVLVAASYVGRSTRGSVDWTLVWIFVLVPLVGVVLTSQLIDCCTRKRWQETGGCDQLLVDEVRRVGDGLAIAFVAVAGLGPVRAFAAPVVRGDGGWSWLMLGAGVVVAVAAFPVGAWLVRREKGGIANTVWSSMAPPAETTKPSARRRVVRAVCILVAAFALLAILLDPAGTAAALGAVALVTTMLGAWVVVVGFFVVYLQDYRPPMVFRTLRMRAAPVLTLFFLVPAVATLLPSEAGLHRIRTLGGSAAEERPTLEKSFRDWLAGSDACVFRDAASGVSVRPMLVVAASGGGIRAALWTALAVDALADAGACGPVVTLLSSGVSGGSVGLAVSRQTGDAIDAVTRLSKGDGLAVGLAGTMVGDLVAGMTGVRPPTGDGDDRQWADRAALIEREWEERVNELREEWSPSRRGPAGALVFNSTAVGFGCRVLVSQVDLGTGVETDPANCRSLSGTPPASLDFFRAYPGTCAPRLRWSTAAMLSARFPVVTPAGRVPRPEGCEKRPDLQLVDGGYAEASGIGTLADIAPRVAALVQAHNAADPSAIVVPVVAYLEDEVRSDVTIRPPDETAELLVPLVGRGAKAVLSASAAHLQRVAEAFADVCPTADPRCGDAVSAVRGKLPDQVVLVAPSTKPSVSAPLGWALSEASRTQLREALDEQRNDCAVPRAGRYAGLCPLLRLLKDGLG